MRRHDEQALGKREWAGVGEEGARLRPRQRQEAPTLREHGHVHWQGRREERLQEGRRDYGNERRTVILAAIIKAKLKCFGVSTLTPLCLSRRSPWVTPDPTNTTHKQTLTKELASARLQPERTLTFHHDPEEQRCS